MLIDYFCCLSSRFFSVILDWPQFLCDTTSKWQTIDSRPILYLHVHSMRTEKESRRYKIYSKSRYCWGTRSPQSWFFWQSNKPIFLWWKWKLVLPNFTNKLAGPCTNNGVNEGLSQMRFQTACVLHSFIIVTWVNYELVIM